MANNDIGAALGRIVSGCSILTVRDETQRTGMLASWVQQAGFEPPMVSVAVKKGRPVTELVDRVGGFVLNVLGEENTKTMFKHFGRGFSPGEDAFAGLSVREEQFGVVIPDQIGWLAVQVRQRCEAGDHWLYVGEVIGGRGNIDAAPHVHIRKSGLTY